MDKALPYILISSILILIFLGVTEQNYIENLTDKILAEVEEAERDFDEEKIEDCNYRMENVISMWEDNEKTLCMMLNHENVHKISEVLIETNSLLKKNLTVHNVSSNFALLKMYIINMKEENEFSLSNIL